MGLVCRVSTPSLWREGSTYNIDLSIYETSNTTAFSHTDISVKGDNLLFQSFTVLNNSAPPPVTQTGNSLNSTLNWRASFVGAPAITAAWKLRIVAKGRPGVYGTDNKQLVVSGTDFFQTTVSGTNSFNKNVKITLADANGASSIPAQPKKFKAEVSGPIAVQLKWAQVDQADYIEISRSVTSDFSGTVYTWQVGGSEKEYLDFGTAGLDSTIPALAPATKYYYRIRAHNTFGDSTYSSTEDATTTATPANPSPPTNVRATANSGSEITVSFEPIDALTQQSEDGKIKLLPSYQASYSTVQGGPYTAFDVYKPGKDIKVTGLLSNTLYYFVVKSSYEYAPAAISANSSEASATTINATGSPNAPSSFTGSLVNFVNVHLTWVDTNANTANYNIVRATALAGPYTPIVNNLPYGTTSYDDVGLSGATTYFYKIYASNSVGNSTLVTFSILTGTLPAAPNAPSALRATTTSDTTIALDITPSGAGTTPTFFEAFRANVSGGPYASIGEVQYPNTHYVDEGLEPNATYYYVVKAKNLGGSSANSPEASATTFQRSSTFAVQSAFTFSPGSSTFIIQIGSRAVFISDLDRMVVFTNRAWFLGGLKRQLNAPVCAAISGGVLADDTYTIYTVLFSSKRNTRSIPSEGGEVTISGANKTITITPDLDTSGATDIVLVRDQAYDSAGNEILAADYVEFYMASSTSANAFLVATVPVNDPIWDSDGFYTLDATLTTAAIFGAERRPMELLGESSLPPACAHGYAKDNRLILFGEKTFTPTADETANGAVVVISQGDHTFEVSNYTLTDGMIYHELYLNGNPTGWEIYDIEGDTAYIRNADPDINRQGYRGLGGSFSDFNFAARASRVYYSAFFTGEADGSTTYSPETFPPLTHFEQEFFPQDNTDPNAIITSNSDLIVGKPSKMMLVRGGSEPDFPLITVISLSQSSGLNAPNTICRDSRDTVYYLGDSGPFSVSASGVQKLNVQASNQNLFQQIFDINSVAGAQGTWYSQQDWFVVAHLNRIGHSGYRDGFIYDPNLELICPFSTPFEITWMQEVKNIFGNYQILFGDSEGRLGILFKPGLSVDGIDYTIAAPSLFATQIAGYMRGRVLQTDNRISIRSFQPQIFVSGGAVVNCEFAVAKKDRMDDPYAFTPQKIVQFTTDDKRTYFSVAAHTYQNCIVQFGFTLPVVPSDTRMSWREIVMEVVNRGPL